MQDCMAHVRRQLTPVVRSNALLKIFQPDIQMLWVIHLGSKTMQAQEPAVEEGRRRPAWLCHQQSMVATVCV